MTRTSAYLAPASSAAWTAAWATSNSLMAADPTTGCAHAVLAVVVGSVLMDDQIDDQIDDEMADSGADPAVGTTAWWHARERRLQRRRPRVDGLTVERIIA